jgi:hypothetical protein
MAEGGDIEIPKLGKLPKKVVIPLAVGLAGFVAWRFWVSRQEAADGDTTVTDGEYGAVDSSIPGVIGAVSPTNSYGSDTGGDSSGDAGNDPTRFTSNAQWSDYVIGKLQQSESWTYNDIVTAIGNGLAGKPTSDSQQAILRAAIAVGGNPPSGSITIVSGGNTGITVAPGNVHVQSVTETSAVIAFNPVSGATQYVVYRSGASANVGVSSGSPITVSGLASNHSYTVQVAALNSAGSAGPKSATVAVKTKAYTLAKPATPTVSGITKTSVKPAVKAVAGADGYRWYINGGARGYSEAPTTTIGGLAPNKKYTVTVAADRTGQNPGAQSPGRAFTTKK